MSPSVLTLADDGRIDVQIVDDGDIVRFAPTKMLSDSPDGLLVSGLKDGQRLVTVGHEYVKAGQRSSPCPKRENRRMTIIDAALSRSRTVIARWVTFNGFSA